MPILARQLRLATSLEKVIHWLHIYLAEIIYLLWLLTTFNCWICELYCVYLKILIFIIFVFLEYGQNIMNPENSSAYDIQSNQEPIGFHAT